MEHAFVAAIRAYYSRGRCHINCNPTLKMRIMEMAHLTDIQTAKVGIVLLLLQILAIII